jgi:Activator of Hsp90 ATPase homolog 1-like protein
MRHRSRGPGRPTSHLIVRGSGSPESDWDVGSTITVHPVGLTIEDPEQVVRESQPYQRLSYTWHAFTPEWRKIACERAGFTEEFLNRIAAVKRSKATFEIAELGERVKLTVTHDGFARRDPATTPATAEARASSGV